MNMMLAHSVILQEARRLAEAMAEGLQPDDLEIDRDGVLVCKALPANGRIPGGVKLSSLRLDKTLDDLSQHVLLPWVGRMARLKTLQEDLGALGVMRDD